MAANRQFVVQKHAASHLHYDFRLEMKEALASWAVPKGPSLKANERRLAIRTEDHDKKWLDFEGNVPEDEYGGGTVMVWDSGTYTLLDETGRNSPEEGIVAGSLKFELSGKKLKGGFALARTGEDDGREKWILFKLDDEHADGRRKPLSTQPDSAKTGRSMKEIREEGASS